MALDNFKEKFIIMNKKTVSLPTGLRIVWEEGAEVMLAPSFDNSMGARQALANGATLMGTIAVPMEYKGFIGFDTYLKWVDQNIYVRIGDNGVQPPKTATPAMQMIQFGAEKITLLPQ